MYFALRESGAMNRPYPCMVEGSCLFGQSGINPPKAVLV